MRRPNADLAAIGVSLVCIVHCLCLPALLTLVPALAGLIGQDIEHSTVHWTLLAIAVPISTWTLVRSLSRHGGGWLLATGLAALALLFLAVMEVFGHALETPLTVLAATILLGVHVINFRRCQPDTDACHEPHRL